MIHRTRSVQQTLTLAAILSTLWVHLSARTTETIQGLRVDFHRDGVTIGPALQRDGEEDWRLRVEGIRATALGDAGIVVPALPKEDGLSVNYQRGIGTENWTHAPGGLTLRFDFQNRFDADHGCTLDVATDLEAWASADGTSVAFLHDGRPVAALRVVGDGESWRLAVRTQRSPMTRRHSIQLVPTSLVAPRLSPVLTLVGTDAAAAIRAGVLSSVPHWVVESNRSAATLGASVATVGDVDGDGYSDVVVGAPTFATGELDEGRAFLYRGSSAGLSTSPSWTIESNVVGAQLGSTVAPAGDVNGDGFADFLVAADAYSAGVVNAGRVLLFLGSAKGPSTTPDWIAGGLQANERFGSSVAPAGDVDGDGYDDVIVGAPFHDAVVADEGRAVLYLGSAAGLGQEPAWTSFGGQNNAQFGAAVAGVGDVDADGYADLLVGAPRFNGSAVGSGRVFHFRGSIAGPTLSADWTADGDTPFSSFGAALSPAGDLNGDGYADFAIGAPTSGPSGRVHLFHGAAAEPAVGPVLSGPQGTGQFGSAVATAGDVNGDGYADLVIGDPRFSNGETHEGGVFLFTGGAGGLSIAFDWQSESNEPNALFGTAVATGGDVNGDGLSDIVVGAPRSDNGQTDEGRAFSFLGSTTPPALAHAWEATGGFFSLFGTSIASAGDVNGDGFTDVIVGSPFFSGGPLFEGQALLYLGSRDGLGDVARWTFESGKVTALAGQSVASAGDVNGDGYADVAVGAPGFSGDVSASGRVFVFLGPMAPGQPPDWIADGTIQNGGFGFRVASAGDVNGDGYADLLIGAPGPVEGQPGRGRVELYLGSAAGLGAAPAWSYDGTDSVSRLGSGVASAGDVNGDGFDDVIVGAPTLTTELRLGEAFLFLGAIEGLSTEPVWRAEASHSRSLFGASVAGAGDVNGDGFGDVIIGENNYSGSEASEGRAVLYSGSPAGLSLAPMWEVTSMQAGALLGSDVSSAGDVNADGYGDLLVGVSSYSGEFEREGQARIYLGGAAGPGTIAAWSTTGQQDDGQLGEAVAFAGDVDGDGVADVLVGAPQHSSTGLARLYSGNDGPGRPLPITQRRMRTRLPLGLGATVDSNSGFRIRAVAGTAVGRGPVGLEWETQPAGAPFDGSSSRVEPFEESGTPGEHGSIVEPNVITSGLREATFYHWRARYISPSPFFPHSTWRSVAHRSLTDTRLRTAGTLVASAFGLIGPAANERVFPDAEPLIFSWKVGNIDSFKLEWSLNPAFRDALVVSPAVDPADGSSITVYRPDKTLWLEILRLASGNPEIRDVPIFWRVKSEGVEPTNLRVLRIAAAAAPIVTFPPNESEFLEIQPPKIEWERNHNESFRIVFAGDASLSDPIVDTGKDYDITEPSYEVPVAKWDEIISLAATSGNRVHYAVFARDALDRITWSRSRTLRIIGSSATLERNPPDGTTR